MSRCLTISLSVLSLFALGTMARADVNDKVKMMQGPTDSKGFAVKAGESGLYEVKLAQLAQQKASSNEVKELAKQLEQQHTAANNELAALAKQKNITLPTQLSGECDEAYQAFQKLDGPAFDSAYLMCNIMNHLGGIMTFQNEARNGTDPDIKAWAAKTLPVLRQHAGHIGTVAQSAGIPIDLLSGREGARPAGSKVEGTDRK